METSIINKILYKLGCFNKLKLLKYDKIDHMFRRKMSIDYILRSLMKSEKLKYILFNSKERICFDELRNFDYQEHNENFTEPYRKGKILEHESQYFISMINFQNKFLIKS